MSEIEVILGQFQRARHYSEIFGQPSSKVTTETHVKRTYRQLARRIHPDKFKSAKEKEIAAEAFKLLGQFYERAKKAAGSGSYGAAPKLTIATRRNTYEVGDRVATGEITDLYTGVSTTDPNASLLLKIARNTRDNDLLKAEAAALKKLHGPDVASDVSIFFPVALDSFVYRDDQGSMRQINVMPELEGFVNLERIRRAYPAGVNPLDAIWIWRRLLWLLGGAHSVGVLHGAVLPPHVMVHPEMHGVMLVDWCYSQSTDAGSDFLPMRAASGEYLGWYPKEVTEKRVPSNGTDIYLAVRSMIYLLGADSPQGLSASTPRAIRAFFRGCLQENHRARPQDAWALLAEFDELLEELGQPYFPRKFHPFTVPTT